jgi:hypothetical protein
MTIPWMLSGKDSAMQRQRKSGFAPIIFRAIRAHSRALAD